MGEDLHHGGLPAGAGGPDPGDLLLDVMVGSAWLVVAAGYLVAGRAAALRGRPDRPAHRTAAWLAGTILGLLVTVGPPARAAHDDFVAHMLVHLVLGMLVPLLLVLGAPVTLFLRAVPVRVGRRYSRIAGARLPRLLAHPWTALLLTTVPLALIYGSGRSLDIVHHPVLGPLVHLHFLAAGFLFTFAVVGPDPNPHRARPWVRGSAIVAGITAHGVVAKHMIAVGQQGVPAAAVEQGAQLMYYGGDVVHALVLVMFCAQIYRSTGRRLGVVPGPGSPPGASDHRVRTPLHTP
ncbi:cytochrome c oxidase assembly protein [Arthrobacter sp. RIT-PI-e]|uniref:cytochrome c oxidase assembly protein n=1 Tax=Arthrobacter sp. RIT-PI-e TaxID=1681197 RepID=UPI0006760DB4|nr:cytochrome c oxidase assembly protein [Arthrobacter sp. RIT-PI-e]